MCGIAGILSLRDDVRVGAEALRAMAATLVHRGPDDEGLYLDPQGRCGLAIRRLAVIDPPGGRQPVASEDGQVHAVCNGEIYNFRTLRRTLASCGHRFRSRGDSEIVVHAYEQWGEDALARLEGMFALAVWDARRGRLLLARDRLGKKPLFVAQFGGQLCFASEAKAIRALPGAPRAVDPQALHAYLVWQYVPAPRCIYRGWSKLAPGHRLSCAAGAGHVPAAQRWWALPDPPPFDGTPAEALEELDARLLRAVGARLVSDVPLGAFLSGGIDSSVIVALMHRLGVRPLRTFSVGFDVPGFDETGYARRVAQHFGTQHREFRVTVRAAEALPALAWHYDEPFADSSALPTWYLARCARQEVTVALTGDGGDEVFGGYDRYRALHLTAAAECLPAALRRLLARGAACLPAGRRGAAARLRRLLAAADAPAPERYRRWMTVLDPALLAAGYRPELAAALDLSEPRAWFAAHFDGPPPDVCRAMRCDLRTYLPGDLLVKLDIASMACGLECRCPLLDPLLVEFALRLPACWRVGGTARGGKAILRRWAQQRLPPAVVRRTKMGFGVPVGHWFRHELRDTLRVALLEDAQVCARLFRRPWLEVLVQAHLTGRADHGHALWALVMLEQWQRCWSADWDIV